MACPVIGFKKIIALASFIYSVVTSETPPLAHTPGLSIISTPFKESLKG